MWFWIIVAVSWLGLAGVRYLDFRRGLHLQDLALAPLGEDPPRLSVIVAACNEEDTIATALRSLLEQDYPNLELVVVNDRSTDGTGAVLRGLEGDFQLVEIHELPPGWLGKNHALHTGAQKATGELLLFTDADVRYAPHSLTQSVQAMRSLQTDHLVIAPLVETRGFWEKLMIPYFFWLFGLHFRPEVVHCNKRHFVGVGAFNMITRAAYQAIGGHESMPLQVADDMMLGKRVKEAGLHQVALMGEGEVTVRWAVGLRGVVGVLEKNAYAGMGYSPPVAIAASLALVAWGVLPLLGMGLGGQPAVAGLLAWLGMGAAGYLSGRVQRAPAYVGFAFPLAGVVMGYILLRSFFLAERRGGIWWRGTFYPLHELRSQRPLGRTV